MALSERQIERAGLLVEDGQGDAGLGAGFGAFAVGFADGPVADVTGDVDDVADESFPGAAVVVLGDGELQTCDCKQGGSGKR